MTVRVREAVEHLCGDLDGVAVGDAAAAEELAQRAAGDVLVGDVDVTVVAAEPVGADAALVPQARRRLHLPHRTCGALPLARDDLERDLEPRALVAGQPDGARSAATERASGR